MTCIAAWCAITGPRKGMVAGLCKCLAPLAWRPRAMLERRLHDLETAARAAAAQWTSTNATLPVPGQSVLLRFGGNTCIGRIGMGADGPTWTCIHGRIGHPVTHWRPLPPPPEETDNEREDQASKD